MPGLPLFATLFAWFPHGRLWPSPNPLPGRSQGFIDAGHQRRLQKVTEIVDNGVSVGQVCKTPSGKGSVVEPPGDRRIHPGPARGGAGGPMAEGVPAQGEPQSPIAQAPRFNRLVCEG